MWSTGTDTRIGSPQLKKAIWVDRLLRCKRAGTILPIDGASRVGATYIQSIVKAGGTPIIIPAVTDGKVLRNIVSNLDGLVLIGGADVNPLWYEEEPREKLEEVDPVRDLYELKLIKMATDQNIPVLGICRDCNCWM